MTTATPPPSYARPGVLAVGSSPRPSRCPSSRGSTSATAAPGPAGVVAVSVTMLTRRAERRAWACPVWTDRPARLRGQYVTEPPVDPAVVRADGLRELSDLLGLPVVGVRHQPPMLANTVRTPHPMPMRSRGGCRTPEAGLVRECRWRRHHRGGRQRSCPRLAAPRWLACSLLRSFRGRLSAALDLAT